MGGTGARPAAAGSSTTIIETILARHRADRRRHRKAVKIIAAMYAPDPLLADVPLKQAPPGPYRFDARLPVPELPWGG